MGDAGGPAALVERLGQQYVLSKLAKSAGSGPRLLLDEDKAAGRPMRLWSTVLRLSSEGGDHTGSRRTPTAVGAVMMLRDGRLGLRADEGRGSADDAVKALLEQQAGSTRGRGPADELAASLARMAAAVPQPKRCTGGPSTALDIDGGSRPGMYDGDG